MTSSCDCSVSTEPSSTASPLNPPTRLTRSDTATRTVSSSSRTSEVERLDDERNELLAELEKVCAPPLITGWSVAPQGAPRTATAPERTRARGERRAHTTLSWNQNSREVDLHISKSTTIYMIPRRKCSNNTAVIRLCSYHSEPFWFSRSSYNFLYFITLNKK